LVEVSAYPAPWRIDELTVQPSLGFADTFAAARIVVDDG
jgi:hypothetical protein